jgi:3-methyl-2-oxobutanoate hydroxymethyltransferase
VAQFLTARLRDKMKRGERIVSLTAYDYFTALIAREANADFVLVGDSLGNVIQGAGTTVPVTLEQAIYHTRIVCRHFPAERVVLDMPFGTFKLDARDTVRNCVRAFQESGCGGVKFEGATGDNLAAVAKLVDAGVPVLGHLGLLPQQVYAAGGYRLQGRTARQAKQLLAEAKALAQAGCFGIVLECMVPEVAEQITQEVDVATIGIGSGASTRGQIIVTHDVLGMLPGEAPSFVKRYADLYDTAAMAAERFAQDVRAGRFPESGAKPGTGALYGTGGQVETGG